MKLFYRLLTTALSCFIIVSCLTSCEEEYIPKDVFDEPEIVVEGYIEYGDSALPPYVILTKSSPYLSELSPQVLSNLFIRGAEVSVSDGTNEVVLQETCLSTIAALDTALARSVAQAIGLGGANISDLNYCIYVDVLNFLGQSPITPQIGQSYYLTIIVDGDTITSVTTIPPLVIFDSIFVVDHPDFPTNDSLVELRAVVTDPPRTDYYRAFTQRNSEPMYAINTGSVVDDKIFNGGSFELPVQRAQPITEEIDINTFGYFSSSQGPFSSYVRIESNIICGLGIWGGIAYKDYQLIVPH